MAETKPTVEYRDIQGHPGYRAGSDGSIWSCRRRGSGRAPRLTGTWRQMTAVSQTTGYLAVLLSPSRRHHLVHTLVLLAFVGPRPAGMQCCHRDGDRTNNRLENLRWGTWRDNYADQIRHGTDGRGERNPRAKLTEADVRHIRSQYAAGGVTQKQLAAQHGVTQSVISHAITGRRWSHVKEH